MESSPRKHDERSLLMHRLVGEHFRRSPAEVVRFALDNLQRWRQKGVDSDDFAVWERLLQSQPEKILQTIEGEDEEAVRLRQSSPFAGLVPEDDRRRILATIP
jgi:Arc/MetJ-type ribon-helix-helix transcriptional regulator